MRVEIKAIKNLPSNMCELSRGEAYIVFHVDSLGKQKMAAGIWKGKNFSYLGMDCREYPKFESVLAYCKIKEW